MELMDKGGPVMWPLLAFSLFLGYLILERGLFWVQVKRHSTDLEDAELPGGGGDSMRQHPAFRLWEGASKRRMPLQEALERELDLEALRLHAREGGFDLVVALAPLLGIFGTVTGIIRSFAAMGNPGEAHLGAVGAGISEALITTACGLAIAMPALVFAQVFRSLADRQVAWLESLAERLVERRQT